MVAEFEGDLIRLRTREGMRVAKAKGPLRGKQPKLNVRQEAHLVAELGDLFGVARSTVYRAIQRDAARQRTALPGRTSLGRRRVVGDPVPKTPVEEAQATAVGELLSAGAFA